MKNRASLSSKNRYQNLLGGLTPQQFMKRHWQKKPLLVRAAISGFGGALTRQSLLDLCQRDDLESRFVSRQSNAWKLEHGPFRKSEIKRWKQSWTVLVQSVNLVLPEGDELLRAFNFIPYARLDDLMVSYATDGAGVGAHVDNYDVFLLQGSGTRRWRIGKQEDHRFIPDQPLRILQNFVAQEEHVLESGDMLYLPPQWAHDGIAEASASGDCMTWSIGFRAPPAQELADQFLSFLQDNLQLEGRYRDPDLSLQKHPAEIGNQMVEQVEQMLSGIRWKKSLIREFLGRMLTEPKPQVVFDPPQKPMSLNKFRAAVQTKVLQLDPRTQLLFSGQNFYVNGEHEVVPPSARAAIRQLADQRHLPPSKEIAEETAAILHCWYTDGFVNLVMRR